MSMIIPLVKEKKLFPPSITRLFNSSHSAIPGEEKTKRSVGSTSVGKLLSSIQPAMTRSILLGHCLDGLPFIFDLNDPSVGGILIGCEAGYGKTHQLQVLVDSARFMNGPRNLQIFVLTAKPHEWESLSQEDRSHQYIQGVHAWYDIQAEQIIQRLTDREDGRREGDQHDTTVLFVLDDLNLVEDLSLEAQVNLRWLLEYGSLSDVWVIGSINANLAPEFRFWTDPFRTRILGRVLAEKNAEILGLRKGAQVQQLSPAVFRVWTGDNWLTYQLPPLGNI